jgi:hypothetical protein
MGGAPDVLTPDASSAKDRPLGLERALLRQTCVTRTRIAVLVLFTTVLVPAHVWAQADSRFAVGGEFKTRMAGDKNVRGELGPGLLWRFGQGKPGFGFHWGLNWFGSSLDESVGGARIELAEIYIRPFMAGYGYTYKVGRYTISAVTLAGYAFSAIEVGDLAVATHRDRLGAAGLDADVSNTFTLKPELDVWYDLNKKIGIHGNAGYIVARPDLTVRSSLGEERRTIHADQFMLKIGLAYSIF